jgi:parallel beta-helix repeat protein
MPSAIRVIDQLHEIVNPGVTKAALDALTPVAGRLRRVTDDVRGLWMGTDTQWFNLFGEAINVKEFGAKGDGSGTDDRQAFIDAIAAAPDGSTILVPDGDYTVDTSGAKYINLKSNLQLVMAPNAIIRQKAVDNETNILFRLVSLDNVRIIGGRLVGDRVTPTGGGDGDGLGIYINSSTNILIDGTVIQDFYTDGIAISGGTGAQYVTIHHCKISNCRRNNMSISNCSDFLVEGSRFVTANGRIPQSGVDVEPNTGQSVVRGAFSHCLFAGNTSHGLYLNLGSGAAVRDIAVSGCSFNGNGMAGVSLQTATDCTVTGNNFTGNSPDIALAYCSGCAVTGNESHNAAGRGIYMEAPNNCTVVGNTVTYATLSGIEVTVSAPYFADQNVIANNVISSCTQSGIYCQGLSESEISGNAIGLNGRYGIFLSQCIQNEVVANQVIAYGQAADLTYNAIHLGNGSHYNNIQANMVRKARHYHTGTAQAGGDNTITLEATASAYNDFYNTLTVVVLSGTGSGQTRTISDYVGSSKVATVSENWVVNPDLTSVYEVRNANRGQYGIYIGSGCNNNVVTNNDLYKASNYSVLQDSGTGTVTTAGNRLA